MIAYQRLKEREKELNCIYSIKEILKDAVEPDNEIFSQIINLIPPAWQYPTICEASISFENQVYKTKDFREAPWHLSSDIIVDNNVVGSIDVVYTQMIRMVNNSQFLPEEQKLLNAIANIIGNFIFSKKLEKTINFLKSVDDKLDNINNDETMLSVFSDEHWKWRRNISERIAERIDPEKYGVVAIYILGSTKNANAGPGSDIDLLIHFRGDEKQLLLLKEWIGGWSFCLAEMNLQKTGYFSNSGLIDLHIITDEDIKNKTSFAVMIGSNENSAQLLKIYTN